MEQYSYDPLAELKRTNTQTRSQYISFLNAEIAMDLTSVSQIQAKKPDELTESDLQNLYKGQADLAFVKDLGKNAQKFSAINRFALAELEAALAGYKTIFEYKGDGSSKTLTGASVKVLSPAQGSLLTNLVKSETPGILVKLANYPVQTSANDPIPAVTYIAGVQPYTDGIADDVKLGKIQPTLEITGESYTAPLVSGDAIHNSLEIGDGYSVSFKFRLNKFPSKAFKDTNNYEYSKASDRDLVTKKFTTRRSDIITFDYEDGGRIEFAAMAPFGLGSEEVAAKRPKGNPESVDPASEKPVNTEKLIGVNFDNKFAPFSIAAAITDSFTGEKLSFYTDYKFELGTWYQVTLKIERPDRSHNFLRGLVDAFISSTWSYRIKGEDAAEKGSSGSAGKAVSKWSIISGPLTDWLGGKFNGNDPAYAAALRARFSYSNHEFSIMRFLNYISRYTKRPINPINKELNEIVANNPEQTVKGQRRPIKQTKVTGFGSTDLYTVSMQIDGVSENIVPYRGKVWSKKANSQRKSTKIQIKEVDTVNNKIAIMPGFRTLNLRRLNHSTEVTTQFTKLSFNRLISIFTAPYRLETKDNFEKSNTEVNSTSEKYHSRLYNRYLHRLNHGIDFDQIRVEYIPVKYSAALLTGNDSQEIDCLNSTEIEKIAYSLEGFNGENLKVEGLPAGLKYSVDSIKVSDEYNAEFGGIPTIPADITYQLKIYGEVDDVNDTYEYSIILLNSLKEIALTKKGSITVTNSKVEGEKMISSALFEFTDSSETTTADPTILDSTDYSTTTTLDPTVLDPTDSSTTTTTVDPSQPA